MFSGGCIIANEAIVTVEHISTCRSAFDKLEEAMALQGFKKGTIYSVSRKDMAWETQDEGGNTTVRFDFPARENLDTLVKCSPARSELTVTLKQLPLGARESFKFTEDNLRLLDGLVKSMEGAFGEANVVVQSYPKGNDWNEVRRAQ
jgi:hypothetical protein